MAFRDPFALRATGPRDGSIFDVTVSIFERVGMSTAREFAGTKIAVIVPCYNEVVAVGKVVSEPGSTDRDSVIIS